MGAIQVRRLPVLNRDKRLVGIIALGDIARVEANDGIGMALSQISRPTTQHAQLSWLRSAHPRSRSGVHRGRPMAEYILWFLIAGGFATLIVIALLWRANYVSSD
ncbi:hypothetical protein ACVILK_002411 [Bradyrhizobium embrapense]